MKNNKIQKFINHLQNIINNNISIEKYIKDSHLSKSYFINNKGILNQLDESDPNYSVLKELLTKVNFFDSLYEEGSDNRSETIINRDSGGKITSYDFKIYIRNKEPIIGTLNRDEMNMIYRLYSNYGSNITQREVSRFFPEYSLIDFRRILRTFNITKASAPFAPHIIEETPTETLLQMQYREKENDFLRKLEAERIRNTEQLLNKYAAENYELKQSKDKYKDIIESINFDNLPEFKFSKIKSSKTLFIWLSDMHIGADVSDQSLYNNTYNEKTLESRLLKIIETVSLYGPYKEIVVCNLGDSIDGMDRQTCRRDHYLPQNMTNKEQAQTFMRQMMSFIKCISTISNNISYYCVGDSNHGGDFEYVINLALCEYLKSVGIYTKLFDRFIGHFNRGGKTFIISHGKDSKDMGRNWPLYVDQKLELYISEYIDNNNIKNDTIVVKGDLHQSATSYSRRFTYKSVGSIFGSSEWIMKNFGFTKACCDYSILDNNILMDGRIILQ